MRKPINGFRRYNNVLQDEHLKRQLQELPEPRLHLSGQNQISSQQNDREISCSPPMLPLLGMLTIWKYITRQEMVATYTTVVSKNLVEWATVMWSWTVGVRLCISATPPSVCRQRKEHTRPEPCLKTGSLP